MGLHEQRRVGVGESEGKVLVNRFYAMVAYGVFIALPFMVAYWIWHGEGQHLSTFFRLTWPVWVAIAGVIIVQVVGLARLCRKGKRVAQCGILLDKATALKKAGDREGYQRALNEFRSKWRCV